MGRVNIGRDADNHLQKLQRADSRRYPSGYVVIDSFQGEVGVHQAKNKNNYIIYLLQYYNGEIIGEKNSSLSWFGYVK